jgi:hypothetical protein
VALSQVDLLNRSEDCIEECYDRSQHFFETDLPTWLNKHEHEHEQYGKRLAQGKLFRSLLVFSFKNKVILNPCQGCANRSVETRPFPLLTVCSPIEPTYLRSRFLSWVGRRRSQHHRGRSSPVRPYSWHFDAGFWLRPGPRTRTRTRNTAALFALRFPIASPIPQAFRSSQTT